MNYKLIMVDEVGINAALLLGKVCYVCCVLYDSRLFQSFICPTVFYTMQFCQKLTLSLRLMVLLHVELDSSFVI